MARIAYSDIRVIKESSVSGTGFGESGPGVGITANHVLVECSLTDQVDVVWQTGDNSYDVLFKKPGTNTSQSVSATNVYFMFGVPVNV